MEIESLDHIFPKKATENLQMSQMSVACAVLAATLGGKSRSSYLSESWGDLCHPVINGKVFGRWVSPSVTFPKGISGEFQVTSP